LAAELQVFGGESERAAYALEVPFAAQRDDM
jgi:hypothetical protein